MPREKKEKTVVISFRVPESVFEQIVTKLQDKPIGPTLVDRYLYGSEADKDHAAMCGSPVKTPANQRVALGMQPARRPHHARCICLMCKPVKGEE